MVILDCDDPAARQEHAGSIGVRVANLIRHENYYGVRFGSRGPAFTGRRAG
jgi:hypothetical protein